MRSTLALLFLALSSLGSASATQMTGTIYKSNKNENVVFDLKIASRNTEYEVKGNTSTDKGVYHSNLDYQFVSVMKSTLTSDGRRLEQKYDNSGTLHIFPRERRTENMTLAGIPIGGSFLQGWMDDGLWLSGLTVGGSESKGCLDYNSMNGHYNAKDGCGFGDCQISSAESGKCAFDYDDYWFVDQNAMEIRMQFKDLKLTGRINFNDTVVTDTDIDDDGDVSTSREVIATLGSISATIVRNNGAEFVLDPVGVTDTSDDRTVRTLISFFELMAFDMFSE